MPLVILKTSELRETPHRQFNPIPLESSQVTMSELELELEPEQPAPIEEDNLPVQTEDHAQPVPDVSELNPKLDIQDEDTSGLITLQCGTSNT